MDSAKKNIIVQRKEGCQLLIEINNWTLIEHTPDEQKYVQPLFAFVLNQFTEIFGTKLLKNEPVVVYNDSRVPYPMLIINQKPIMIRTSVKQLNYWCQYIYQLSHELMHYVARQYRSKNEIEVKWFEETVCEAMSLYTLRRSSEKWSECVLSKTAPGYSKKIKSYLDGMYAQTDESVLKKCHTLSSLQEIERTCEAADGRLGRSQERNYLYNLFYQQPEFLPIVAGYSRYAQANLQLDLDKWNHDVGEKYISKLLLIHPNIN